MNISIRSLTAFRYLFSIKSMAQRIVFIKALFCCTQIFVVILVLKISLFFHGILVIVPKHQQSTWETTPLKTLNLSEKQNVPTSLSQLKEFISAKRCFLHILKFAVLVT